MKSKAPLVNLTNDVTVAFNASLNDFILDTAFFKLSLKKSATFNMPLNIDKIVLATPITKENFEPI